MRFFFFFFFIWAPLHTQEGDTSSLNYTSCFGVPFGALSLALDTDARQTAMKESPGRNTRRTGGKGSSGEYASLRIVTHRWHWKRVPGPAAYASLLLSLPTRGERSWAGIFQPHFSQFTGGEVFPGAAYVQLTLTPGQR